MKLAGLSKSEGISKSVADVVADELLPKTEEEPCPECDDDEHDHDAKPPEPKKKNLSKPPEPKKVDLTDNLKISIEEKPRKPPKSNGTLIVRSTSIVSFSVLDF